MPIDTGKWTDSGYRFRKNEFEFNDHYVREFSNEYRTFYDIIFFNYDVYNVD